MIHLVPSNAGPSAAHAPGAGSTSPRPDSGDFPRQTARHPSHPNPRAPTSPAMTPAGSCRATPEGPTGARGVGPSMPSPVGLALAAVLMVFAGGVLAVLLKVLSMVAIVMR